MRKTIPTHNLDRISGLAEYNLDVFYNDILTDTQISYINVPYRSNYFGIGICVDGRATLKANLETYTIERDCIITMSPQIVKEWIAYEENYKVIAVFFKKDFLIHTGLDKDYLDRFGFFDANAKHVSKVNNQQAEILMPLMHDIQRKLNSAHIYKHEIVRNLINILLYEIAAIYTQENPTPLHKKTRSEQIAADFKELVRLHFVKERSVNYYAEKLFISPKHLTEIVKNETGKSAKEFIDATVVLEAKVLLQDSTLTITNIADSLHFVDQSIFGKYFKNLTGISPLSYQRSL
jgi:AraC family transcriptional regulator, transcriptional activator of pobA